ncbi:putative phosphoesterase [Talaromyces proteolyticus]|uniref:Phosphoesterase n=1 Tax=Talaromyces proteolyticus TaxID=1131652 RepID=A0AAD4PYK6_9EURO|nr:putative phosphoesterase [Talaromyces proteolyticus]KAH8697829.1 putative phosphoesterase [Talaromyces proteolyticus]
MGAQIPQRLSIVQDVAKRLYSWNSHISTLHQDEGNDKFTICCISDTHNSKPSLPDGDVLLHAGDLSQYGTFDEIQAQIKWLDLQPHKHKIVIAGNHDLILDQSFVNTHPYREIGKPGKTRQDLQWGSVIYLEDSSYTIRSDDGHRKLRVYGSPQTPKYGNFAFQYDPIKSIWNHRIPDDIDILLSHGPPAAHLDEGGKGCKSLLQEIWRVKPKLVVFGHIHGGRGHEVIPLNSFQAAYEDITVRNHSWVALIKFIIIWAWQILTQLFVRPKHSHGMHLVNAAVMGRRDSSEKNDSIVIHL